MIFTIKRFLFVLFNVFILCLIGYYFFFPLYTSNHVIIDYGISPFNVCIEQPLIWKYCKYWFVFTFIYSSFFISNLFFNLFSKFFSLFSNRKNNYKKKQFKKCKKEKKNYSFIENPISNLELKLLIR